MIDGTIYNQAPKLKKFPRAGRVFALETAIVTAQELSTRSAERWQDLCAGLPV